jgi:hypothetical protein
MMSSADDG